jgi:hypothetical protein
VVLNRWRRGGLRSFTACLSARPPTKGPLGFVRNVRSDEKPSKRADRLGANYWKLKFDLRAKLESRVSGAVPPLICWIWGGVRPPGAVAPDIRAGSTLIRR